MTLDFVSLLWAKELFKRASLARANPGGRLRLANHGLRTGSEDAVLMIGATRTCY